MTTLTNRERLESELQRATKWLTAELDFIASQMVNEQDQPFDLVGAFCQIADDANLQPHCYTRHQIDDIRRILIAAGYFQAMSPGRVAATAVSSGKAWDFKRAGVRYVSTRSLQSWLAEEPRS